jgi:hypothetical protein
MGEGAFLRARADCQPCPERVCDGGAGASPADRGTIDMPRLRRHSAVCWLLVLVAIFAAAALGGVGYTQGMNLPRQLAVQLIAVLAAVAWSAVATAALVKLLDPRGRRTRHARGGI